MYVQGTDSLRWIVDTFDLTTKCNGEQIEVISEPMSTVVMVESASYLSWIVPAIER